MKTRKTHLLLSICLLLFLFSFTAFSADNHSIQLGEHLAVAVQPGETVSISFDLCNDESYTWEDCVIILEDADNIKLSGCDGGITYNKTATKCYVQFKDQPVGTIEIYNDSNEIGTGSVWLSEAVPVESFEIANGTSSVVGGDAYVGDFIGIGSYFYLKTFIYPENHKNCFVENWTSSNESVATIDGSGRIEKIQAGETTITASLSNGMEATYDLVLVEPERLYSGYEKTITINPGEECIFLVDEDSPGQYVFYTPEYSLFEYGNSLGFGWSAEAWAMGFRNKCDMLFVEYSPQESPCSFSLSNFTVVEEKLVYTDADPVTVTVNFEKAVPIESIELHNLRGNGNICWVNNPLYVDAVISPFLAKYEQVVFTSSDDSVIKLDRSDDVSASFSCVSVGDATITVTSASGVTASRQYTVYEPFLSGENSQWTKYSGEDLTLEINANIEDNLSLYIDNYMVMPKNYTVTPGSTPHSIYVSIHHDYLQSLNTGTFEVLVYGSGGQASTTVTILEGELTNPFTDVSGDSYYEAPVLWAVDEGITNGTTATTFSPEDLCTRAQVVTFLWRTMGSPEPTSTENPFEDVVEGEHTSWYYKAVLWAVENGITNGRDETHFAPDGQCLRSEVVMFLWRTAQKPASTLTGNSFQDTTTDHWFYAPVMWAVGDGITNGTTPTTFSPDEKCTRAQIVTFLYRYAN